MNPAPDHFEAVPVGTLVSRAAALRKQEFRLVQISATRLEAGVELTYSFDRELALTHLRVMLPAVSAQVPSISSVFGCAVLYENEIHDLFNVQVEGMALDFHGQFYKTTVKFPFGSTKAPGKSAAKPPPASAGSAQPGAST